MAKETTIDLEEPITGHEGPITQIVLREPRYREITAIGKVSNYGHANGTVFEVENDEAIRKYIEACLVSPKSASLLEQLCMADTFRVREAVLDFFRQASAKIWKA